MSPPSRPSPLLATFMLLLGLGAAAYESPQHLAAAGLALMTGSALIAAPDLLGRLLSVGSHPRVVKGVNTLARLSRGFALAVYLLLFVFVILVAAVGRGHFATALTVAAFFIVVVAGIEITFRQVRSIAIDVVHSGHIDDEIDRRWGSDWRWIVAGTLFLAGTLLQLIGTFVE